ncbi:MAG: hypothetical protein R3D29_05465 [Nitratireductor sp.]
MADAGAVFAERIGWEVPMYYDPENPVWSHEPSLGWKPWSEQVRAESLAARDHAVLIDQSMYGKILVQGPDAARALNRVCGAEMDVPTGTSGLYPIPEHARRYRGRCHGNASFAERIHGHNRASSQTRDKAWIRRFADPQWRFEIFDATSGHGLLSIHGPRSRQIMTAISGDDLSNEAFPFGAAREIDMAYARAGQFAGHFWANLALNC